ncbi:DUF4124 domain-containing protein [Aquipseudomonas campi]|uniref:DUF4124 domain-containing protein n=1 Tax=Aquipseudomonas campi TaxID=2731681 RepID=A0A6M8F1J1_9GAMM|nr:DUF4124 domain-containing protein [Pseudomonas campi]QKE62264.1 DUF4124 domain-containing protein [Pseudomonas campi]
MRRLILTGSLLLALSTTAMAGQVYKWVDAQGNTHFGSQPPEGQQATSINTNVATPKTPAPAAAKPAAAVADTDEQKAIDSKVKEDVAKQEAERKQYCETVRTNLAQLQNNPRVRVQEEGKDEMRRLTEEERQERISEAEKGIAENCQ